MNDALSIEWEELPHSQAWCAALALRRVLGAREAIMDGDARLASANTGEAVHAALLAGFKRDHEPGLLAARKSALGQREACQVRAGRYRRIDQLLLEMERPATRDPLKRAAEARDRLLESLLETSGDEAEAMHRLLAKMGPKKAKERIAAAKRARAK
jgi:hypothetical protein